jgi:hypothetical protein
LNLVLSEQSVPFDGHWWVDSRQSTLYTKADILTAITPATGFPRTTDEPRGSGAAVVFFWPINFVNRRFMAKQRGTANNEAIPTAGRIFPDGTILEILRDASSQELALIRCRGESAEIGANVTHADQAYTVIPLDLSVAAATRFPNTVGPPESATGLFTDVHAVLRRCLRQPDQVVTALVFAVFVSWLSPALTMTPIISIFAPLGSPKNIALQLLDLLCRRPLRLVGVKRGELLRAPMSIGPTLLLDEPDLQPNMQLLLQASARRGSHVLNGQGTRNVRPENSRVW